MYLISCVYIYIQCYIFYICIYVVYLRIMCRNTSQKGSVAPAVNLAKLPVVFGLGNIDRETQEPSGPWSIFGLTPP